MKRILKVSAATRDASILLAVAIALTASTCSADSVVSTIAGSPGKPGFTDGIGGAALFHTPLAVASDKRFLYVADTWNSTIRMIDPSTGAVTTIAGKPGKAGNMDGTGSAAEFWSPSGLACDGKNLFVADTGNKQIRKISLPDGEVSTIAPSGLPTDDKIDVGSVGRRTFVPYAIATDGTSLYFTDPFFNTIWKMDLSSGAATIIAGQPGAKGHDDGPGHLATFNSPMGIAVSGNSAYVTDGANNTIRKIALDAYTVTTIAGHAGVAGHEDGFGPGASFQQPTGICVAGEYLYVADGANRTLRKIALSTLQVVTIAGRAGQHGYRDGKGLDALFEGPVGIVVTSGAVYLVDSLGQTLREVRVE